MIIRGNEFKTVVVVLTLSLVVTPLMVYPVYTFPIRQQRIDDICIGRSRELNIILYDFNSANQEPRVVQLVVLVGIIISMVEFFNTIYIMKSWQNYSGEVDIISGH